MQSNVIAKRVLLPTLSKNLCSANRSWLTLPPVEEKCVCVSVCTLGGGAGMGVSVYRWVYRCDKGEKQEINAHNVENGHW